MKCDLFVSIVWFDEDYKNLDLLLKNLISNAENKITIGVCLSCNKESIDKIVSDYSDQNVKFIPLPTEVSRYSYGRYLTQQMITNETYYFQLLNAQYVSKNWDTQLISLVNDNTITCFCNGYPFVKKCISVNNTNLPIIALSESYETNKIYLDSSLITYSEIIKKTMHKTNMDVYGVNEVLSVEHHKYKHKIEYKDYSKILNPEFSVPVIPDEITTDLVAYINENRKSYSELFSKSEKTYQIVFEFSKYIIKKIDSKIWNVIHDDKEMEFTEVSADYKSHTIKNSECMFRILRNGEALYDYINNKKLASNGNVLYDTQYIPVTTEVNKTLKQTEMLTKGFCKIIVNNSSCDAHYKTLSQNGKYDLKFVKSLKFPIDELKISLDTHSKFIYFDTNTIYSSRSFIQWNKLLGYLTRYDVVYGKARENIVFIVGKDSQATHYIFSQPNIFDALQKNPQCLKIECVSVVNSSSEISINEKKYITYIEDHPKLKEKIDKFELISSRRLKKI
jgi:hypothetical protein